MLLADFIDLFPYARVAITSLKLNLSLFLSPRSEWNTNERPWFETPSTGCPEEEYRKRD